MDEYIELPIVECRNCKNIFFAGDKKIEIKPGMIIILGSKKIIKMCNYCQEAFKVDGRKIHES